MSDRLGISPICKQTSGEIIVDNKEYCELMKAKAQALAASLETGKTIEKVRKQIERLERSGQ